MSPIEISLALNFQSCLVHYINYVFHDLAPTTIPIILTRYTYTVLDWNFDNCDNVQEVFWQFFKDPSHAKRLCKEYKQNKYLLAKLNLTTKMKWNCLAQFYLYPLNNLYNVYRGNKYLYIPLKYFDFGTNQVTVHAKTNIDVTSRSAFRVLVSEEEFSQSNWLTWSPAIAYTLRYYPASYLVHIVKEVNKRSITNAFIGCVVCARFSIVPEKVEVSELTLPEIRKTYRLNFLNRNAIPVSFDGLEAYTDGSTHSVSTANIGEFATATLPRSTITRKVFAAVFPNYTEISLLANKFETVFDCWWCSSDSNTHAKTGSTPDDFKYNTRILLKNGAISYLTCSIPENEGISFKGFLSAFDGPTWICLSSGTYSCLSISVLPPLRFLSVCKKTGIAPDQQLSRLLFSSDPCLPLLQ